MAENSPVAAVPKLRYIVTIGIATVSVGTVVYHYLEDWSWLDSLYFSVVTLSTVGYGDPVPKTDPGKVFTIFYIIVGIGIFAAVVNFLVKRAAVHRMQKHLAHQEHNEKK